MQREIARYREVISQGMVRGIQRSIGDNAAGVCPACGFSIPPYPGRYPKYCPQCGTEIEVMYKKRGEKEGTSIEDVHIFPMENNMYKLLYNNGLYVQYSQESLSKFLDKVMVYPDAISFSEDMTKTTVKIMTV